MRDKNSDTDVLYIGNCPVKTKRELKKIATANRRSMEAQAIVFIEEGARRFAEAKAAGLLDRATP